MGNAHSTKVRPLAETMPWAGLLVAGLSGMSLVLYSLYWLIDGVFAGGALPQATGLVVAGVVGVIGGISLSLLGFLVLLRRARADRLAKERKRDDYIAA